MSSFISDLVGIAGISCLVGMDGSVDSTGSVGALDGGHKTRRVGQRKAEGELAVLVVDLFDVFDRDLDDLPRIDVGQGGAEQVRPPLIDQEAFFPSRFAVS